MMDRTEKYRKKLDSGIIGQRYDATKDIAIKSQEKYFASAEELELKVKSIVSAEPSILHHYYIAFAEEIFKKKTLQEQKIIYNKWVERGLSSFFLLKIVGINLNGLVAYWNFNEGAGLIAHDTSGYGNHGTGPIFPTWTAGKVKTALSFNGINNYVNCGNDDSLEIGDGDFTLAAWIKNVAFVERTILAKRLLGNYWHFRLSNGKLRILLYNGILYQVASNTAAFLDGKWHHGVVTRKGSTITFYKDGSSDGGGTSSIDASSLNILQIGVYGGVAVGYPFGGVLDEVMIFNRALSPAEIKKIYDTTK